MKSQENNLYRRQRLVSSAHIHKLESLSRQQGVSATEIVRRAIAAYDPNTSPSASEEAEASLDAMVAALHETRERVADLRQSSVEYAKARERDKVRRYFEARPEALAKVSQFLSQSSEDSDA